MVFVIYTQTLATIGPVVSEIMCLMKIDRDARQTDRRTATEDHFFRTVGREVMKRRENMKLAGRLTNSISLRSGIKNVVVYIVK